VLRPAFRSKVARFADPVGIAECPSGADPTTSLHDSPGFVARAAKGSEMMHFPRLGRRRVKQHYVGGKEPRTG